MSQIGTVGEAVAQADNPLKRDIEQMIVDGDEPTKRNKLHLSDVISKKLCYRKATFAALDYPQNPVILSPDRIKTNAQGWAMHKRWQQWAERAGVSMGAEIQRYVPQWLLAFTPDDVWKFSDGIPRVVEIKGYDHTEVARILRSEKPPHDALVQVNCYCYLVGIADWLILVESKGKIIDFAASRNKTEISGKLALEFRKGTQEFFVWEGKLDPAIVEPYVVILNTIKEMVRQNVASGVLHPGICTSVWDYTAKECPFKDVCFMSAQERHEAYIRGTV